MYVCMYIYIYIHIHIYVYTYILAQAATTWAAQLQAARAELAGCG